MAKPSKLKIKRKYAEWKALIWRMIDFMDKPENQDAVLVLRSDWHLLAVLGHLHEVKSMFLGKFGKDGCNWEADATLSFSRGQISAILHLQGNGGLDGMDHWYSPTNYHSILEEMHQLIQKA